MTITKLEAAQQQLDCAIRLLFNLDDMPSTITLSRAASRVLFDLYSTLKPSEQFAHELDSMITHRIGWPLFNKIANQLKHADKDADAIIDTDPGHAMAGIGLSISLYRQIAGKITHEMRAFEAVMTVLQPDVFADPIDPSEEGYDDFMRAVEHMKNSTHEQRMQFGRETLHLLTTGGLPDTANR